MKVETWRPGSERAATQFAEVLALHRESKATLGPMPDAAFRDRARNDGLVLALIDDRVAGYILYDLPRHHMIKLVHFCIGREHRGKGIAKALLDQIIADNPNRSAITAACRRDYGLDEFWRAMGMYPANEKTGRSSSGKKLVNWVRRIGQLDIFEDADLNAGLPLAVLDSNIISGLYSSDPENRTDREVEALENDWVRSSLVYLASPEVDYDLNRIADPQEREHQMRASSIVTRLRTARPDDTTLERALLERIGADEVERDKSLLEDVKHLADAIHGRADFFVTNDDTLIRVTRRWLSSEHQLKVVRPYELLKELRPNSERSGFESKLIDDFDLEWSDVDGSALPTLELTFLDYPSHEKPAAFQRLLRRALSRGDSGSCEVLSDRRGRPWALLATEMGETALRVPLLRTVRNQRGGTVAYQLLRFLRKRALSLGLDRVTIADPSVSPTLRAALERDGFVGDPPTALLIPEVQRLDEFLGSPNAIGLPAGKSFVPGIVEARHWPLVLTHTGLTTYVVPIKPTYAERLFGFSEAMHPLRRARGLGLSREHVYFCSPRAPITESPARLLWYVTADDSAEVRLLAARSTVSSTAVMRAETAFQRYGRLGVLGKADIVQASDEYGMVRVVRFQETELLEHPLPRRTLMPLLKRHKVPTNVPTARRADFKLFDDVMALQRPLIGTDE